MLCVAGTLKVTDQNMLPESPSATCKKEKAGDYCLLAGESNRVVSLPWRSNNYVCRLVRMTTYNWYWEQSLSVSPVSPGYQLVEYRLICLQLASRSRQMHFAFSFLVSSTPFMRQLVWEYERETEETDRQTETLTCPVCAVVDRWPPCQRVRGGWELSTPSSSENTTASLKSSEPSTPAGMMTRFSRSVQHALFGKGH